ncbi:MAG TPA: uroporphyrinogen-III synthase [Candidatus Solibacter sp.]|jgi:uroporphyrinogen III methyltransferase/synthase|nr:uroporphyrinogen-III synthase [Candidatus Solibacter sp.]
MTAEPRPNTEDNAPLRLAGKRVLVTRRTDQAGDLSEQLRRLGADVIEVPLIQIDPPRDVGAARRAISGLAAYDDVVFTSVNAVAAVKALAIEAGIELAGASPRVIAIGPATAEAVRGAGLVCEELPERFTSKGVLEQLKKQPLAGRRLLLPRSGVGRQDLPAALRDEGALVDDVAVYTTNPSPDGASRLREALPGLDVVTFASGSAVTAFVAALPEGWQRPEGLVVAVIGPATASASAAAGLEPDVIAAEHAAEGLARAVGAYFVRS